jgi:hypothetical protein
MTEAPNEKDDATLKVIGEIYNAFGIDAAPEKDSALFDPISEGLLAFDKASESIEYTLKCPVELKNGDMLKVVKFHEATGGDLEYIRKGVVADRGLDEINIGDQTTMTLRTLVKIANISTNVVDRFKRRDVGALSSVLTELGFFYG